MPETPTPAAEPLAPLARLVFLGLLAVLVLTPLPFGSNRDWSLGLLEAGVGLLLVLWALAAFRQPALVRIGWRRHWPLSLLYGLSLLWMLLQASDLTPASWDHPLWREASAALGEPLGGAVSVYPGATFGAALRLLAYGGVFWLALQFGRDPRRARAVLWAVAAAGLVYALYGLLVELSGAKTVLWYRKWAYEDSLTGTFINRNNFATYCGFALLATLSLLFGKSRQALLASPFSHVGIRAILDGFGQKGWLYTTVLGVISAALLLTHSRAGFLSAFAGAVVLVAALALAHRMRVGVAFAYGSLFLLFTVVLLAISGATTLQRLDRAATLADERLHAYALTADAIGKTPLLGTGHGTFQWIFAFFHDDKLLSFYDKAHNTYLEYALGGGLPALAVLLLLFAVIGFLCLRGVLTRQRRQVYPSLGLAVLTLGGVHALVDFSLQIPAVATTFAALLGTALAQSWRTRRRREDEPAEDRS